MSDIETRLARAEAATECEKVMSRHCYLHASGIHREEYFEMWSKREDITFAHTSGQNGNRFEYFEKYVLGQESKAWKGYKQLFDVYPEVKKAEDYRPLFEQAMHFLTTPVIEVAEDGQSAKALWYTPGLIFSTLNPQKALEGVWCWERYGADFVLEDGQWKYLNLLVCPDVMGATMDSIPWTGEGAPRLKIPSDTTVSIPGPLYFSYSEDWVPVNMPAIPVPHKTQSDLPLYSDVKPLEE